MFKPIKFTYIIWGIILALLFWKINGDGIQNLSNVNKNPEPTPDLPFTTYSPPQIKAAPFYVIAFLGDSMTHALGPHGGKFTEVIKTKFPTHDFIVSNYAVGSTNVLSIPERLTQPTTVWETTFPPLLEWKYDVLIIESFGYNPLSQYSLEEGLRRQTETLNQTMKRLLKEKPDSLVVFLATIAPSETHYAKNVLNLSSSDRLIQVNERIAYIKNHINYAQSHNIPIINVYEKSLTESGAANLKYINPDDYIHPSFAGVDFLANEIATFIYEQQLLPR